MDILSAKLHSDERMFRSTGLRGRGQRIPPGGLMSGHRALAVAGLFAVLTTSPAFAQEGEGRGVVVFAQGGGFSPLTHLDELGSTDFKTGYNVGGGVAYQVNRYVAVRGNFTFARAEARYAGAGTINDIAGTKFNRFLYDADVQLRYPLKGGAAPYVFVGGGAVTDKQAVTPDQLSVTNGARIFVVGLSDLTDLPYVRPYGAADRAVHDEHR